MSAAIVYLPREHISTDFAWVPYPSVQVVAWLNEHVGVGAMHWIADHENNGTVNCHIYFEDRQAAMLFKLTWG